MCLQTLQARVSPIFAPVAVNCPKHERRKKNYRPTAIFLQQSGSRDLVVKLRAAKYF
jgi:hypothetical protein